MIEVEAPDGTVVEFPDGTDDGTIDRVMRENFMPAPAPERSMGQVVYDNIIGDPNDGVQSYGEQLGTWLNRAGESMTVGLVGDEASAAATGMLPGRSYEGELQRYRDNEANMSTMGRISADLFGAVLPAFIPGGQGGVVGAASRYLPTNMAAKWMADGASLVSRVGRGAVAGATIGGVQGFMDGEGDVSQRFDDGGYGALVGGGLGMIGSGLGEGVSAFARSRATNRAIADAAKGAPTSEALRAEGNALYRQIDDAGVQIKPEAFDRMRADMVDNLRGNTGFDELPGPGSLTPNTGRVVEIMDQASNRMAQEPTAALPFKSLDQMRRQAGAAAGNVTNKTDQAAGSEVIRNLDNFIRTLGPDDVVAGDVRSLQTAIPKAREVWQRMSKSQRIDDAIDASENYLGGGASGVRNQFKNLLQNKKAMRGFSDAEKSAMRKVVNGGPLSQLVTLMGGGVGQLLSIGGGAAAGGIPGALGGAALAAGQRRLSDTLTSRAAEQARAAIASGKLSQPGLMQSLIGAGQRPAQITRQGVMGLIAPSTDALRSR